MVNSKPMTAVVELPGCFVGHFTETKLDSKKLRMIIYRIIEKGGNLSLWASVKGEKSAIKQLSKNLASTRDVKYVVLDEEPNGLMLYITFPAHTCSRRKYCPLVAPSPYVYPRITMVGNGKTIAVIHFASQKVFHEYLKLGLKLLDVKEERPYYLTPRQEEILTIAYDEGYYRYPRRSSLKDIARKRGLSVSTVAETLRKAECKLIRRYVENELFLSKFIEETEVAIRINDNIENENRRSSC